MRIIYLAPSILFLLLTAFSVEAVEVAPRISDREIIESLAEIKGELKAIDQRFDDMNISIDQRFDDMNTSINQRFSSLESTMLTLFSALIMLMVALFGYIAWDRRTYMRPIQERMDRYETILHKELDITNDAGSVLTRLVKALKQLAKTDQKVAEVLRSFSLL